MQSVPIHSLNQEDYFNFKRKYICLYVLVCHNTTAIYMCFNFIITTNGYHAGKTDTCIGESKGNFDILYNTLTACG